MGYQERLAYINGDLMPESGARISIFDSSIMTGDTLTESTRTFLHVPYKLREHIDRLLRSARAAYMTLPWSADELERITLKYMEVNAGNYGPTEDRWITHNLSRGPSVTTPPELRSAMGFGQPTLMIFESPLKDVAASWADDYRLGVHAVTPATRLQPAQTLDPKIKNRSRLAYNLGQFQARELDPKAYVLMMDTHGNIAENNAANFAIVTRGRIRTPTTRNILPGISRATVLELAAELGIPAVEEDIQLYDVLTADEAFFTSTPYCLMPCTKINNRPIGDGLPGPITRRLLDEWGRKVGVDLIQQAESIAAPA